MRWLRVALWPAGLAFGVAAEWVGRPDLIALDAAAGFALVFLGLVAWSRRPGSRAGAIMSAAGFAWFLGTLWPPAVFWHRGPLAQAADLVSGREALVAPPAGGDRRGVRIRCCRRGCGEPLYDGHLRAWPGRAVGVPIRSRDRP